GQYAPIVEDLKDDDNDEYDNDKEDNTQGPSFHCHLFFTSHFINWLI
ncbi:hypothetical protein A2U01_0030076, partial [Trifolium medium]|nr:hypothetical protein [Trifolium medium]